MGPGYPTPNPSAALVSPVMERLCERPGCSDTASVAYGMRPEDLVFWLDRLDGASSDGGVLCLRHADAMVVPRSWTLDDLRDPDLHLFRPPAAEPAPRRTRRSANSPVDPDAGADTNAIEQLELGVTNAEPQAEATLDSESSGTIDDDGTPSASSEPWSPSFDDADDLGGLLAARSPLLARAFRGDDRPRT